MDRRAWGKVGAAGAATLLAAALLLVYAPSTLDVVDAPLRALGAFSAPLALARLLGWLGNAEVLVPALLLVSVYLVHKGRVAEAALVLGAFVTQEVAIEALKQWIARPRPSDAWIPADGWSFPSGHAARAALVACLLVHLNRHRVRLAVAVGWALLGAAARVILGVHHATDVAAGLGLGLAVGALGVTVTLAVQERRSTVRVPVTADEPPAETLVPEMAAARLDHTQ